MKHINIFVTVGSQQFQFNRLLRVLDDLPLNKYKIFAQIGYSTYFPKNYKYVDFIKRDEFVKYIQEADLIITHAGTGAIVNALKENKPVIAVARLSKYNEHVDNHQEEILNAFNKNKYLCGISEIENIDQLIEETLKTKFNNYLSHTNEFIKLLKELIGE